MLRSRSYFVARMATPGSPPRGPPLPAETGDPWGWFFGQAGAHHGPRSPYKSRHVWKDLQLCAWRAAGLRHTYNKLTQCIVTLGFFCFERSEALVHNAAGEVPSCSGA
jgi:hypothetical protein